MTRIANKDKMGKTVWMNQCLRIGEEARRKKLTKLINVRTDYLILIQIIIIYFYDIYGFITIKMPGKAAANPVPRSM